MDGERLIRWLGFGCLLAGVVRMGMTPTSLIWGFNSFPELLCGLIACLLMAVCSLAFYLVQARETGAFGFATAVAIMIGNALTACAVWSIMARGEPEATTAIEGVTQAVMSVGVLGGALVLSILSWRAKVLPRWAVVCMVSMLPAMAIPLDYTFAFFWGLGYVVPGYCIWKGRLLRRTAGTASGISA